MSDREFERYLAILGGLLRLSARRREEIAAELRDHLEERLEELLADGMSRHEAILTALEEFGDAAGLAGEFLQVFRRQRRRWVMRMTVGSVAVCIALCLSIMALWPDNNFAPPGKRAIAQEGGNPFGPVDVDPGSPQHVGKNSEDPFAPEAGKPNALPPQENKKPSDPFAPPSGTPAMQPGSTQPNGSRRKDVKKADPGKKDPAQAAEAESRDVTPEDNNRLTERKLAQRLKASYTQIGLRDVLDDISKQYDVDIYINKEALQDSAVDLSNDLTVDLNFKSNSGDMLLGWCSVAPT